MEPSATAPLLPRKGAVRWGLVEGINLQRRVLRDLVYIQHCVPNGLTTVVFSLAKNKSRANLNIEVGYRANLEEAIRVMNALGEQVSQDELFWRVDFRPC